MAGLKLWCPHAERVDLVRDGDRVAMRRDGDWFHHDPGLRHGEDYAFSLDGADPLPDPRSACQPYGVHGASRWIDHDRFAWTDDAFSPIPLEDGILYELHVGTFTREGTLDAAIDRLDHLVRLGITHVELLPVVSFAGERGWGYDGVGLYAVHRAYGGPEALRRFVDACHQRGLAVLLDVVYNHLGPEGNYLDRFGPYFSWRHRTPWGKGLNLDEAQAETVRELLRDNVAHWIRHFHIDGFRLDATHALVDSSAVHILEELAVTARDAGAERGIVTVLIAEHLTNDPRIVSPIGERGLGMQAQWCDDFHHALHVALTGERHGALVDFEGLASLARCLTHGWYLDGRFSDHRGRRHGRPLEGVSRPGHTLVSYIQNHDQVGNRAHGERLGHQTGPAGAKIGAALTLLGPATPMLFMGQEWGANTPFLFFTDFQDRGLGRAVEKGRARELAARGFRDPPNPQAEETFRRSVLDWREIDDDGGVEMLSWYRALVALRRERASLRTGALARCRFRDDGTERWLVMQRDDVAVAVNFGEAATLPVAGDVLLSSPGDVDGSTLPPSAVAIYEAAAVDGEHSD